MNPIIRMEVDGFRGIRDVDITCGPVHILLGENGSGKTSLLDFFRIIQCIQAGGDTRLLADILPPAGAAPCRFTLWRGQGSYTGTLFTDTDGAARIAGDAPAPYSRDLAGIGVYHFDPAACARDSDMADCTGLKEDGSNLASVLYRVREQDQRAFGRIARLIRIIAPGTGELCLVPAEGGRVRLLVSGEDGSMLPLKAISPGVRRFLCMAALFGLPDTMAEDVIFLDEPELGLSPFAVSMLAEQMQLFSMSHQLFAATQSTDLAAEFYPQDLIMVKREEGRSTFRALTETEARDLEKWLVDFSLGEVWKKRILPI